MVLTTLPFPPLAHCAPTFFGGSAGHHAVAGKRSHNPQRVACLCGRTGPEGSSTRDLRPIKALVPKVLATRLTTGRRNERASRCFEHAPTRERGCGRTPHGASRRGVDPARRAHALGDADPRRP